MSLIRVALFLCGRVYRRVNERLVLETCLDRPPLRQCQLGRSRETAGWVAFVKFVSIVAIWTGEIERWEVECSQLVTCSAQIYLLVIIILMKKWHWDTRKMYANKCWFASWKRYSFYLQRIFKSFVLASNTIYPRKYLGLNNVFGKRIR